MLQQEEQTKVTKQLKAALDQVKESRSVSSSAIDTQVIDSHFFLNNSNIYPRLPDNSMDAYHN